MSLYYCTCKQYTVELMETPPIEPQNPVSLDNLLGRGDIWVGQAKRSVAKATIASGNNELDKVLAGGWPLGSLLEICQEGSLHAEWSLLASALANQSGSIFLIDPPFVPFGATLAELGIDLNRLYIVRTSSKALFVSAVVELAKSSQCGALLAWQPKGILLYAELRKILLACADGTGIYALFRPSGARKESSPAGLRIIAGIEGRDLTLTVFKQRGMLENHDTVVRLGLSEKVDGHLPLNQLHEIQLPGIPQIATPAHRLTNVIPLRRR